MIAKGWHDCLPELIFVLRRRLVVHIPLRRASESPVQSINIRIDNFRLSASFISADTGNVASNVSSDAQVSPPIIKRTTQWDLFEAK